MLAPKGFGEITSGGLREDDIVSLTKRILEEQGLNPATYDWYLDLRRYGSVPHRRIWNGNRAFNEMVNRY